MAFKSLYLCYFGLREPLVQTQVLPYLREIRKDDIEVSILTFEPDLRSRWTSDQISAERAALAAEGIAWHCLAYHKRPSVPATFYDIFRGTLFIRRFIAKYKPDVLHGRVHIPTLMGALARKLSRHKPKLLFDIRGFFPEEYTDAGVWPEGGWLYRSAKRVEKWLLKESDGFVVLTEKARQILFPKSDLSGSDAVGRPVEVIPCCLDPVRFSNAVRSGRPDYRHELGVDGRLVLAHTGSLGGLYLTEQLADLLTAFRDRDPSTFAMILTQSDPDLIVPLLEKRGFTSNDYLVTRVPSNDVPRYLLASDIGLSLVKAGYATASRSPTKIPEYLAAGLPVISNAGVGDVDVQLSTDRTGIILKSLTGPEYIRAINDVMSLLEDARLRDRCLNSVQSRFDLYGIGGVRYRRIYECLIGNADCSVGAKKYLT